MKKIIILVLLFSFVRGKAQERRFFEPVNASETDQQILTNIFKSYSLVQIPLESFNQKLKTEKKNISLEWKLPGNLNFNIVLEEHELRSAYYIAEITTDSGTQRTYRTTPCHTYKGTLSNSPSSYIRATVSEEKMNVVIHTNTTEYFLEPLQRYVKGADKNVLLFYAITDIKSKDWLNCGGGTLANEIENQKKSLPNPGTKSKNKSDSKNQPNIEVPQNNSKNLNQYMSNYNSYVESDCLRLEIATEIDWDGFSDGVTNSDVIGILNMVEPYYFDDFGVDFVVNYQHSWNTSSDPYNEIDLCTSGLDRIDEFRDYWNANYSTIGRDIGILFSGVDFTAGVVGCAATASLGNTSNTNTYAVMQTEGYGLTSNDIRKITTHELGHIFGSNHDDCSGYANNTGPIMCPSIGLICNSCSSGGSFWSNNSITAINGVLLNANNNAYNQLKTRTLSFNINYGINPLGIYVPGGRIQISAVMSSTLSPVTFAGTEFVEVKAGGEIKNLTGQSTTLKMGPCLTVIGN